MEKDKVKGQMLHVKGSINMEPKINSKEELTSYLNSISILLLIVLLISLPILFITLTTDFFILPKQILTGAVVLITLVIFTFKMIVERAVRLRRTVFDLPLTFVILSTSLSCFFAVNRFDSLIALVPFIFATLSFFVIVNFVRNKKSFYLLIVSLGTGAVVASIISLLSFFNIHILPFSIAQTRTFTTFGSIMDQAIYLGMLLPIAIFFAINETTQVKNTLNRVKSVNAIAVSIVILVGFLVTIYQLFNPSQGSGQRLTILPFETGFQTAMASISQDTGRPIQSFLFGSGFGTYITDFTRFKQPGFNQNDALWGLTFFRSSSFILEILATIGILGFLSFIYIIIRMGKTLLARGVLSTNPISISLILSIIVLFVLPASFTIQALFFVLLALFSVFQGLKREEQKTFFDIELQLVALKKGLFTLETFTSPIPPTLNVTSHDQKDTSRILPVIFAAVIFIIVGTLIYFSIRYLISDIEFQSSLVAAAKNQGQQTYQKQNNAIATFPYRDSYYRVFSQTNLALANSLSSQQQGATPSAETQRTIYALIQQSINAGRAATARAPLTSLNWQNLSSIYRSLIGFGQNAENFAIITQQQALLLDPNNPQGYIILGGIYYQLGLWENAQSQFQIAVNLKPNFANAHYNLGHALENKGDLPNALREYQTVKNLVIDDQNSLTLITREIETVQNKIERGESTQAPQQITSVPPSTTPPLNLSTPSAQLPPQNPPLKIPAPSTATESGR